ncbi:hypothetical protein WI74_24610 [Burkholderia ubonensis]|nr:hypothetical protein WI74_24610 [Burkholderia ubonensis]
MFAAVDLDQFTQARTSCPRLVDLRRALPARHPQAGVGHQLADRLLGEPDAVTLPQLLAGQRRPKIRVALADDRQGSISQSGRQLMIARLTSLARHQASRALASIAVRQPFHLTSADAEPFRGPPRHQPSVNDRFDNFESIQLAHAHRDRVGVIGHDGLPFERQEPPSMNQSGANYDISIWLSYDITTWFLQI